MDWLLERGKFYAELRRNPIARMQEQMADMEANMMPPLTPYEQSKPEEKPIRYEIIKRIDDNLVRAFKQHLLAHQKENQSRTAKGTISI